MYIHPYAHAQRHTHTHTHTLPSQEKYSDMEDRYKEAMVSSAQLYNEKTTVIFQVENLKDRSVDDAWTS